MHCETCPTRDDCHALNTLLSVMEKHKHEIVDPTTLSRYEELSRRLADARWAYPFGVTACRLAGRPDEIRQVTEELVALWRPSAPELQA